MVKMDKPPEDKENSGVSGAAPKCANCIFSQWHVMEGAGAQTVYDPTLRECRVNPPKAHPYQPDAMPGIWPLVKPDWWCGGGQFREPDETPNATD